MVAAEIHKILHQIRRQNVAVVLHHTKYYLMMMHYDLKRGKKFFFSFELSVFFLAPNKKRIFSEILTYYVMLNFPVLNKMLKRLPNHWLKISSQQHGYFETNT